VCVSPKSAKGWHKRDFAIFSVKFNFCRKRSATKFLCVKISSGKVVATSLLYLAVYRWIAGDVPIYLKFTLRVTHPFRKRRFRQNWFRLILQQPWDLVNKVQLSGFIANRKSTMHFPSSHRWTCTLPLSPPIGWLNTRIFTFGVVFHFFVAGNRGHFIFGVSVEHSKSQSTDDKLSLKGAWSQSRDLCNCLENKR